MTGTTTSHGVVRTAPVGGLTRTLYVNDHALLSVNVQAVVSDEGSRYERGGCVVMGVDASGRIDRFEQFAADDFAPALARLDELGATPTNDPQTAPAGNAATAVMARIIDLCHERRFDEMRALAHRRLRAGGPSARGRGPDR